MSNAPVRFLFDYVSPYAYIAWTQLPALARRYGRAVECVPVLFGGLLAHWETKGPAEVAPKRDYLQRQTLRLARTLRIDFVPPPHHPFNPLLALRVSSLEMPEADRERLVNVLFRATWADGTGVSDRETVIKVLTAHGYDGEAMVRSAESADGKSRLRVHTETAISQGVFGVPTMFLEDRMYWGYDAFDQLEQALRGEPEVAAEALQQWRVSSSGGITRTK